MAKAKKGKYAEIIDKLPQSFGEDPDDQAKINALKAELVRPDDNPEPKMSSDAIEELVLDVVAMLEVLNNELIRPIGKIHGSTVSRLYADVRKLKDIFDKQERKTTRLKKAIEQILVDQYEVEGVTGLKMDEGDSVRIQFEPAGRVIDPAANLEWAINSNLKSLLRLPWQTVNALTKQALLNGDDTPLGVEVTSRPKVVYTKA